MINQLMFIYLMCTRDYSLMRFDKDQQERNGGYRWGACDQDLHFDYGHSGRWAHGNTKTEAVINLWRSRYDPIL